MVSASVIFTILVLPVTTSYANTPHPAGFQRARKCSPGTYSKELTGLFPCSACEPGTFSSDYGATQCTAARPGYHVSHASGTTELPCPGGTFSVQSGSSTCQPLHPEGQSALSKRSKRPRRCLKLGYKACPQYSAALGGISAVLKGYECVDVANNLESCGGCVDPIRGHKPSIDGGRDCSSIPGVDTVRCEFKRCVVDSCSPGFVVSSDGDNCIFDG